MRTFEGSLAVRWVLAVAVLVAGAGGASSKDVPPQTLRYEADGEALVIHNGRHFNNRPLYGNHIGGFVLAGDRPFLRMAQSPYVDGCFMVAVVREGKGGWLADAGDVTTRYRSGCAEWTVRDSAWPGLTVHWAGVPLAEGPGMAVRLRIEGGKAGDRLVWCFGGAMRNLPGFATSMNWGWDILGHPELLTRGFTPEDCRGNSIRLVGDHFVLQPPAYDPPGSQPRHTVVGRGPSASRAVVVDASGWQDPAGLAGGAVGELPIVCGALDAGVPLEAYWAFAAGEDSEAGLNRRTVSPADAFAAGVKRLESVSRQVTVETPDALLNATVAQSCLAMDGMWYPPVFAHGAMQWNLQLVGWRTLFGAIAYGWHDRVLAQARFFIDKQIRESANLLAKADPKLGYGQQARDSRFYGRGFIPDQGFYDMQSQFFDQVLHDWRWTADPVLEKVLRPALELHLEWMRDCFDPDGDGVYESYINTWPTDSQWYNGAGTAEETAYAYRGHKAALDMARRAGDEKAVAVHRARLEKIRRGFIDSLWIGSKGYVGSYREQMGYKRCNENPWLYSIFLPIDAGLLSPLQAAQALHYTEWGLENERMPYGGRRVWTSNWVPSVWSVREMWPGDNYHLALAYFQTGLAADGWDILRGTFLESACAGPSPGNLGHKMGGLDFNDCASMFCRTTVEGLFGYSPDYPNGTVSISPQLPDEWNHAAIHTPDVSITVDRSASSVTCTVELSRSASLDIRLPVCAGRVREVTVDGVRARWTTEPGFERSLVRVVAPKARKACVVAKLEQVRPPQPPSVFAVKAGRIELMPAPANLVRIEDPQSVLSNPTVQGGRFHSAVGTNEGHHMVFGLAKTGSLEQWLRFTGSVVDEEAEKAKAAKRVLEIPKDARWGCVDVAKSFNGDVRKIYKQQYLSPRPQTCSVRIGSDGYSPWTFYYWGGHAPEIELDQVPLLLKDDSANRTPAYEAGADPSLELTNEVTLEAWVQADPMPQAGGRILDKSRPGTYDGYMLDTYPGNSLRLHTPQGGCSFDAKLPGDRWTHVAAVYSSSGKIAKLFMNGQEVAGRTSGQFPPLSTTKLPLRIGVDPAGDSRFLGRIQRAAVYRRALTNDEIARRAADPAPLDGVIAEWNLEANPKPRVEPIAGQLVLHRVGTASSRIQTPQGVPFTWMSDDVNIAFTSQWDNWPNHITVPVNRKGEAVWLLVCGSSNPMQCGIANAELRMRYVDGVVEKLELVHPQNYWTLCQLATTPSGPGQDTRNYYNYERDGFCLPKNPPAMVALGRNCNANLLNWRLRPGVALESVTLETLSMEVVVGLMGVTVMNPE